MSLDKATAKLFDALDRSIGKEALADPDQGRWRLRLLGLDRGIGGGVPKGRMVEVHGPSDAAKTSLALEVLAAVLVQDPRKAAYMDHEDALDLAYAERIVGHSFGVVRRLADLPAAWATHRVVHFVPTTIEDDAKISETLIRTGKIALTIHDSIPAMTPASLMDGLGVEDSLPAAKARALGEWLPKLKKLAGRHGTTVLWTNHARKKSIGHRGPEQYRPWVVNGGENPIFYADIRIRVVGSKSKRHPRGRRILATVVKNKTSDDRLASFEYHLTGRDGFDHAEEAVRVGLAAGLLQRGKDGLSSADGLGAAWKALRSDRSVPLDGNLRDAFDAAFAKDRAVAEFRRGDGDGD